MSWYPYNDPDCFFLDMVSLNISSIYSIINETCTAAVGWWNRGVVNGAAGAAAAAPIIWLVVVIQKWRTFRRPKHIFSLYLWMQFELILAWQITSGSWGHRPMIFMPKMLYFLIFCSLRSIFTFKQNFNKNVAKNLLKYNNL